MALQASGQIKYSEIIAEFGTPNSGGIGAVSYTHLTLPTILLV